jgi:hypothetical protein
VSLALPLRLLKLQRAFGLVVPLAEDIPVAGCLVFQPQRITQRLRPRGATLPAAGIELDGLCLWQINERTHTEQAVGYRHQTRGEWLRLQNLI